MKRAVTVECAAWYLACVEAFWTGLPPGERNCMAAFAARHVDGLFRKSPPLDLAQRTRIAIYEWSTNGRLLTIGLAHRIKRAILTVGTARLVQGLAPAWSVRRPVAAPGRSRPKVAI